MNAVAATDDRDAPSVVLDHIEDALLSGDLTVGNQLPPERELAAQLGVGRGAVREAIRVLQAQGIVESQRGPGRGTRLTADQGRALGRLFRLHLALASTSMTDLTETRIALERSTAALAARKWDPPALRRLERVVHAMDDTTALDAFNALDTDYHVEIAVTAQHPFIGDLTTAIREALRDPIRRASEAMPDWQDLRLDLCKQHHQIYDAIAARDPERAAGLMEAHIRTAYTVLKLDN